MLQQSIRFMHQMTTFSVTKLCILHPETRVTNDYSIGWQNLYLLSQPNAVLAPQARASVENFNYVTLAPQERPLAESQVWYPGKIIESGVDSEMCSSEHWNQGIYCLVLQKSNKCMEEQCNVKDVCILHLFDNFTGWYCEDVNHKNLMFYQKKCCWHEVN